MFEWSSIVSGIVSGVAGDGGGVRESYSNIYVQQEDHQLHT